MRIVLAVLYCVALFDLRKWCAFIFSEQQNLAEMLVENQFANIAKARYKDTVS